MTVLELTQRAVDAYNGREFARAECLLLMALVVERERDTASILDGIKATDLKVAEVK